MFENIKKCLDSYENAIHNANTHDTLTEEDKNSIVYFNVDFAKAIMQDYDDSDIIAKLILATKSMVNDIKIKFER